MSEKVYTEEILSRLIEVANRFIDEPDVRKAIVSQCYQEIGMLFTGAPGKTALEMNPRELMALKNALRCQQKENPNRSTLAPR